MNLQWKKRPPNKSGYYWAKRICKNKSADFYEPEIVSFHKTMDGLQYVIIIGYNKSIKYQEFVWGPEVKQPYIMSCPNCDIEMDDCHDYGNRGCNRCQGLKYMLRMDASECSLESKKWI